MIDDFERGLVVAASGYGWKNPETIAKELKEKAERDKNRRIREIEDSMKEAKLLEFALKELPIESCGHEIARRMVEEWREKYRMPDDARIAEWVRENR